jgi:hypothetical protein
MKTNTKTVSIAAVLAASILSSATFAAPPPGKGKPPTPGEETVGNNLSFATKFVPDTVDAPPLPLACLEVATAPTGPKCTLFPDYWCQKTEAVWQAACTTGFADRTTLVTANWGANLLGDASIKAGRPVRVEMVLTDATPGATTGVGYIVSKLTDELDRLATYGTNGAEQNTSFTVWDKGAKLKIETCADQDCATTTGTVLPESVAAAEINSLGNVVYGYNWGTKGKAGAPATGIYKITFSANGTAINNAPGAQMCQAADNCTYVIVTISPSAGGGGR